MNARLRLSVVAVLAGSLLSACVSTTTTRLAVRNETEGEVSVVLRCPSSQATLRFHDIAPSGASPLKPLGFNCYQGVVVDVRDGESPGGKINLSQGAENVVVIRDGFFPSVAVVGQPEPKPVPVPAEGGDDGDEKGEVDSGAPKAEPAPAIPAEPTPSQTPPAQEPTEPEPVEVDI